MEQTKLTREIAGHEITLVEGTHYIAGRPMGPPKGKPITVTIHPYGESLCGSDGVAQVKGLSYDEANDLLEAFNNGEHSFDGRIW